MRKTKKAAAFLLIASMLLGLAPNDLSYATQMVPVVETVTETEEATEQGSETEQTTEDTVEEVSTEDVSEATTQTDPASTEVTEENETVEDTDEVTEEADEEEDDEEESGEIEGIRDSDFSEDDGIQMAETIKDINGNTLTVKKTLPGNAYYTKGNDCIRDVAKNINSYFAKHNNGKSYTESTDYCIGYVTRIFSYAKTTKNSKSTMNIFKEDYTTQSCQEFVNKASDLGCVPIVRIWGDTTWKSNASMAKDVQKSRTEKEIKNLQKKTHDKLYKLIKDGTVKPGDILIYMDNTGTLYGHANILTNKVVRTADSTAKDPRYTVATWNDTGGSSSGNKHGYSTIAGSFGNQSGIKTASGSGHCGVIVYRPSGSIQIEKKATVKDLPKGYSFSGIVYGVYSDKDCKHLYTTIKLNSEGKGKADNIGTGLYYIKEITSNAWFDISTKAISCTVETGKTQKVEPLDKPTTGTVRVKKQPAGNSAPKCSLYSLAGATYEVMKPDGTVVSKLTTGADGQTAWSEELYYGTYYVRETKASPGYKLDECHNGSKDYTVKMHKVVLSPDNKAAVVTCNEPWKGDPWKLKVTKVDENGQTVKELAGAVFRVSYYGEYFTKTGEAKGKTPLATWYLQTKDIGGKAQIDFNEAQNYLAPGYTQSAFYKDESNKVVIPLGTVVVTEVASPEGYTLENAKNYIGNTEVTGNTFIGQEKADDRGTPQFTFFDNDGKAINNADLNIEIKVENPKEYNRFDLEFVKEDITNGRPMGGIPFLLTDNKTGEKHILVSDANGKVGTANSFVDHTKDTNKNDNYLTDGTKSFDDLPVTGIWFESEDDVKVTDDEAKNLGALASDHTYTLTELPCKKNADKQLITPVIINSGVGTLSDEVNEIIRDLGTVSNVPTPYLGTKAMDKDSNSKMSNSEKEVVITDTVSYHYLTASKTYTAKGILMDKSEYTESGKLVPLKDDSGEYIRANTTFTIDSEFKKSDQEKEGDIDVTFTFDGKKIGGREYVIFEYLFEGESNDLIPVKEDGTIDSTGSLAKHDEPSDADQSGYLTKLETNAWSNDTGINCVAASDNLVVSDTVNYKGLIADKKYTLKAVLRYMKDEQDEDESYDTVEADVTDKDGNPVKAEAEFIATDVNGATNVEFPAFDASQLTGKSVVVYEELYYEGKLIGSHKDMKDSNQTIYFPEIKTTATDSETLDHHSLADKEVMIVDRVHYKNVSVNKEYVMNGTLYVPETGEALKDANGEKVVSSITFTPTESEGDIDITFTFDGSLLAGKSVVAFEDMSYNGKSVAVHRNLKDEDQTVRFPIITTTLTNKNTGSKNLFLDGEVSLVDEVAYQNLTPGYDYVISGWLMDKTTNKPILVNDEKVTGQTKFTATEANGKTSVQFTFDANASNFIQENGQVGSIVCFENLMVAQDYEDEGHYESKLQEAYDEATYYTVITCNKCQQDLTNLSEEELEAHVQADGEYSESVKEGDPIHHDAQMIQEFVIDKEGYNKNVLLAVDEDINNVDQTVTVPSGKTKAKDSETGTNVSYPDEKVTIVDTVLYNGLNAGKEYTIKGQLYIKPNKITSDTKPEPLLIDGKPVTAEKTFSAQSANGAVDVSFTFDASALQGKSIVVFEDCYYNNILVFTHSDLSDDNQTIHFPKIGTTAKNEDGKKTLDYTKVKLIDTLKYENLAVGEKYIVYGTIMNKATGKEVVNNGKVVKATAEFTPKKEDGTVDVTFEFSTKGYEGQELVVFEEVRVKKTDKVIAEHKDLKSKDQTVTVSKKPKTPKTGDFFIFFLLGLLLIAGCGILFITMKKKRAGVSGPSDQLAEYHIDINDED